MKTVQVVRARRTAWSQVLSVEVERGDEVKMHFRGRLNISMSTNKLDVGLRKRQSLNDPKFPA